MEIWCSSFRPQRVVLDQSFESWDDGQVHFQGVLFLYWRGMCGLGLACYYRTALWNYWSTARCDGCRRSSFRHFRSELKYNNTCAQNRFCLNKIVTKEDSHHIIKWFFLYVVNLQMLWRKLLYTLPNRTEPNRTEPNRTNRTENMFIYQATVFNFSYVWYNYHNQLPWSFCQLII